MQRNLILLLACSLAAAVPVAAQTDVSTATLDARMRAFFREIPEEPNTALAAFFPRRGDWTWVQTLRDDERGGPPRTGIWRFPGAETVRAIGAGGPACDSFDAGNGHSGPFEGRFGMQTRHSGPWRRVRGNRYVPPGASAGSSVFVEWRREDGEWVVSAFGDENFYYTPSVPEPPRGPFVRDTTPVAEDTVFAPRDWYTITVEGHRLPTYGRPRALDRDTLVRIGHLHGVNVYVERGEEGGFRYLPVAPGQFQPYEHWSPLPCE